MLKSLCSEEDGLNTTHFIFFSLTFFWSAVFVLKFGVFSPANLPEIDSTQNTLGSIGLFASLALSGMFPSLLSGRIAKKMTLLLPIAGSVALCLFALLHALDQAIPAQAWSVARVITTFGIGFSFARTGAALILIPKVKIIKIVSASFCLGALINLGSYTMGLSISAFEFMILTWLMVCFSALIPFEVLEEQLGDEGLRTKQSVKHLILSMPKGFWSICFGLFFYSMVYGMSLVIQATIQSLSNIFLPTNIFILFAGLIVVFILFRNADKVNLRLFQWFLFVPIVIGLFPLPMASNEVATLCCSLLIISFTCYDVTNIAILSEMSLKLTRATALRVFAWGRAANVLGMVLGGVLVAPFSSTASYLSTEGFVFIVFIAILILVVGMACLGKSTFSKSGQLQERDTKGRWVQACEQIAIKNDLSPREIEVILLVAKGRNAEHIGEKLFIAPSTVKTHTSRAYQKLGIHSQQELMDLIETVIASE